MRRPRTARSLSAVSRLAVVAGFASSVASCSHDPVRPAQAGTRFAPVTHGVMVGDVTESEGIVWARTDRYAELHVEAEGGGQRKEARAWAIAAHDYAAQAALTGLMPGTEYRYRVWFASGGGGGGRSDSPPPELTWEGHFRTAPRGDRTLAVTFGWSGDLGGINVCRDAQSGYPIFGKMDGRSLDFFLGLGDMIYGDQACEARGFYGNDQIPAPVREATTVRQYWEHWRYNREDSGLQRFLASTAYVAMWDDHEVVNDFGPKDAWHAFPPYVAGADLVPLGRHALFDYNPIAHDATDPDRLYRAFRRGRNLDLVLLDTRSYRDLDAQPDTAEKPKTMLGEEQRRWLIERVTHSDATWKVIVSSVPLAIPTGRGGKAGHDGWCDCDLETGFERELVGILRAFRDAGVRNVVFLTTDVHFATGLRYRPFPETGDFTVYEFSAGPLGAMLLPNHALDETLHPERLFFFGPDAQPKTFDEALHFMNWGKVAVASSGHLTVSIIDGFGATAEAVELDPVAEARPAP